MNDKRTGVSATLTFFILLHFRNILSRLLNFGSLGSGAFVEVVRVVDAIDELMQLFVCSAQNLLVLMVKVGDEMFRGRIQLFDKAENIQTLMPVKVDGIKVIHGSIKVRRQRCIRSTLRSYYLQR